MNGPKKRAMIFWSKQCWQWYVIIFLLFPYLFLVGELEGKTIVFFEWSPQNDILFKHIFWHSIWHSHFISHIFWHFGIVSGISSEILCGWGPAAELAVQVRWGTLWSGAGGGPVGNTLIRSLRSRSGGEHSDPELGGPAGNTLIRSLEVRRGTLWSGACGRGPAGNLELAVEVRRGSLWSRGWLLFGSSGEHCDLELAVEVRRRRRRRDIIKPNNPHLTGGELLEIAWRI